jgi:hypothetical protein
VERIRKNRLRFGSERIDRDWTFEPFGENRPLVHVEKDARPKVNDEEPYRDRDRTEYKQIFVSHKRHCCLMLLRESVALCFDLPTMKRVITP